MKKKNDQLQLFRLKVEMHMNQYAKKMKVFIAENMLAGVTSKILKEWRKDPTSKWNLEKEALNKAIKREASGLVNRVHSKVYMEGLG